MEANLGQRRPRVKYSIAHDWYEHFNVIRYFMLRRSWIYVGAVQNIPVTTVLAEPFSLPPELGPGDDSFLKRGKPKKN